MHTLVFVVAPVLLCALMRLYKALPGGKFRPGARSGSQPCRLAVFLGSGGHTSEALTLLSALDFDRYRPRTYIVSQGDTLSAKKAIELETGKNPTSSPHSVSAQNSLHIVGATGAFTIITIPRARRVHQSLLTSPLASAWSLAICVYHVSLAPLLLAKPFADVLILNGPGTCVMLCLAVYLNRVFGLSSPKLIYVESFARVKKLSLSGKILRHFVDRFVVQWPGLVVPGANTTHRGWLV